MQPVSSSLSQLFSDRAALEESRIEPKKTVHQWAVNEFVVHLIKGQNTLEYKTTDRKKKEVYTGRIEIPESRTLDQMVACLKICKVMVDESGIASFSQNYHTWRNPNIESKEMVSPLVMYDEASDESGFISSFSNYCNWKDPTTKVNLLRGLEGPIWNIFHRFTKQSSFFPFAEATIPSLRCHPETVALIEKIKAESFNNPQSIDCLRKDFKVVRVIDPKALKKEYETIGKDLEECKKALKDYEALKKDRDLLLDDFDLHATDIETLEEKHKALKINLGKCKKVLELKKIMTHA